MIKMLTNSGFNLNEQVGMHVVVEIHGRPETLSFGNHAYPTLGLLSRHVVNGLVRESDRVPEDGDGTNVYQIVHWDRVARRLELRLKVPLHPDI